MECPASVNHPAVAACIKAKNIKHGIDKFHRCNLKECKYWNPPFDRTLFVCTTGLHIHRCGNKETCPLAFDCSASGFFSCPISGIEMKEQSMTHSDVFKVTSKYGTERWARQYTFLKTNKVSRQKIQTATKSSLASRNQTNADNKPSDARRHHH